MATSPQAQSPDPNKVPAGVSPADWQGIKAAYESSRHAIEAQPDASHRAHNPGQAWTTTFDGRGFNVVPDQGHWTWGLELKGAGDRAPKQRVEGTRLSYIWDKSLTEWFINDERGLEQGWTINGPPEHQSGSLKLELGVRGGLQPEVSADSRSLTFRDEQGQCVVNYGGLKAWDADGKVLDAHFAIPAHGGIALTVDVAGARYPVTIDPVAQLAYLKASNTGAGDQFGSGVAISGDTVVVGAQYEDSAATGVNGSQVDNSLAESGAAYIFVKSGGIWSQQAYLKAHNTGLADSFGCRVAISGDTVVVGATAERSNATGVNGNAADNSVISAGAAYVFTRTGTTWSQQAYLKPANIQTAGLFGGAVAVSGDTVLVGASGDCSAATGVNGSPDGTGAPTSGAAYIFTRTGTTWTQQAYLKASNTGGGDGFGEVVALSGNTAVIGAKREASNGTGINGNQLNDSAWGSGAVYIFTRNGTTWSQQAYVKASNAQADDFFGYDIGLSGDLLVVGAPGEDSNATGVNGDQANNTRSWTGAAYLFRRNAGVWSQEAYLKSSNPEIDDAFGGGVAVSGNAVLIRASGEDSNATGVNGNQTDNSLVDAGAVYLFKRAGTTWFQHSYLKGGAPVAHEFGAALALEGQMALISALSDSSALTGVGAGPVGNAAPSSGAAYLFDIQDRYDLTVVAPNGLVSGGGTYNADATATLTATANPGYLFSGWSGDASGSTNPLQVLMNANKTISAIFVPDTSDADGDGLSAHLEATVYGSNPLLADTDSDGLSDAWEVGRGRFSIIEGSFTWAQARADARSRGGDLASFPDEHRWNRAMEALGQNPFDNYTGLWIGASDATTEGSWTWVNGEAFSYSRWGTGRPSSTTGNTLDFVELSGGAGAEIGKWYDRSSTTVRDAYLLEAGYATDPKVADADGDGLNDGAEQAAGSSPFLTDTDGDGLTDPQEVNLTHTNPKLADSDNDGTSDAAEDLDLDGLGNLAEIAQHGTNPLIADTDADGLNDGTEANYPGSYYQVLTGSFTYPQAAADAATKYGRVAAFPNPAEYTRMAAEARKLTNAHLWIGLSDFAAEGMWVWTDASTANYTRWSPGQPDGGTTENQVVILQSSLQWADAVAAFAAGGYIFELTGLNPLAADTDGDGLSDAVEINTTQSNPQRADTDSDGLSDGAEVNTHQTSPLKADTDEDGLADRAEIEVHYSNPNLKDSDGDGFDDLFEVNTGFNPALASSTPDAQSKLLTAVEFRFNAANGATYRIEASSNLEDWTIIESDIVGEGAVVTRFYSIENQSQRYFRARRN